MSVNPERRFWSKVDRRGPEECWPWMGTRNRNGYGQISFDGRGQMVHRVAYELCVGPIPEGLTLDHLCRVRHCVNPAHLEPVTQQENLARTVGWFGANQRRKTHCPKGHPYDEENTYITRRGHRACRECKRQRDRRRRAENRTEPATHCQRGHAYDGENTYIDYRGRRMCRRCRRARHRRWHDGVSS